MALLLQKRVQPAALRASSNAAPGLWLVACRPSRKAVVAVKASKADEVKALEAQAAGLRKSLGGPDPAQQVTVTPLASSSSPTASVMTIDGGGLLELDKDTFWPYLKAQGSALTVVDFYTDWCGPCKLIYPELVKLSHERTDVRFVKFNCNKANKEIGVQLGIKVAPTFHLYRNGEKVAEMTGAKVDKLVALINQHEPAKVSA